MLIFASVSVMVCYRGRVRRRENLICATFSVMVCYRVGMTEGNVDVCCS